MPSASTTIAAAAMGVAVVSAIAAVRRYVASGAPSAIAYVRPAMRGGGYYALLCMVKQRHIRSMGRAAAQDRADTISVCIIESLYVWRIRMEVGGGVRMGTIANGDA